MIVGPHENIGRLPWWLHRLAAGGEVLAPGPQDAPIQLIDARDLAAWMLDMAAARSAGAFNAIAEPGSATWGELLEAGNAAAGSQAELVWVDGDQVAEALEEPWDALPLWPIPELKGLYGMAGGRAKAAGLLPRPLGETVADTRAWLEQGEALGDWRAENQVTGLAAAREAELLERLR